MAADTLHDFAQHYVRELREGDSTNAFHSLTEADARIVPLLIAEFARASDTALRIQLLRVIAEFRLLETVPFFAERLFDSFWKTALDALVMQASPAAITALERGRARTFDSKKETADFRVRLKEAIEQAKESKRP